MGTKNKFQIGDKVRYNNTVAEIVGFGKPFMSYPVVILKHKALFADHNKNNLQVETTSIIEHGLQKI